MGGAGVCMGLHPPQSKKHMAGNIVRLGRGCHPKACKTMPELVVSTATACLQAASRGEMAVTCLNSASARQTA